MADVMKSIFKDAIVDSVDQDAKHAGCTYLDSDVKGLKLVIGVSVDGEPSDMLDFVGK